MPGPKVSAFLIDISAMAMKIHKEQQLLGAPVVFAGPSCSRDSGRKAFEPASVTLGLMERLPCLPCLGRFSFCGAELGRACVQLFLSH